MATSRLGGLMAFTPTDKTKQISHFEQWESINQWIVLIQQGLWLGSWWLRQKLEH